jgi:PAS domain S-box-containing protein
MSESEDPTVARLTPQSSAFEHGDERYAKIVALAADAIICIDDAQRITLFNQGAEKTFGFAASEIIGQPIDVLIPTRFRKGHSGHVRGFASGAPHARHMGERQAIFALRKSGEEFPADATISKIMTSGKSILTVVLRDISERFNAEERRRQDAEKLRQALVAGKLGGFERYFKEDRLRLFGETRAILGLEAEECHQDDFVALVHVDDRERVVACLNHTAQTGRMEQEYRIRKPDGALVWIKSIGVVVGDGLQEGHLFCTVQDITQQKEIEHELERRVSERTDALQAEIRQREETQKQLVHAQRMEAFGQLTGGVAHDFNNLLTIIGGNLELLQDHVNGERPERQLKRALEAVGMGSRLTQRLLMFARRSNLEPQILNLNEQVISIIDLLRRTIGEDINISSVLAPNLGHVKVDASEVENAILNLAINARDAMSVGGNLIIETSNAVIDDSFSRAIQAESVAPGAYVRLSVADTGRGMSADVLTKAFEPFFTTKEHGRGTGLGLATVYGFARQSGGFATIYSELGVGTTVNIYLPRCDDAPATTDEPELVRPTGASKRILVVEDNPAVRDIAIERLQKLGYLIESTESGPAAIKLLEGEAEFDLVFSDIMMAGGMTGYDLALWISANMPKIKVLLTSGYSEEFVTRTKKGGQQFPVLQKPYAINDLAKALQEVFEAG